jgi:hypothetical protein
LSSIVSTLTGGVAGIAIGEAASVALDPAFEPVKQDAWAKKPTKVLELGQLADLVAQALNALDDVLDSAERNGYDRDQLASAIQLALKAPGAPDAEKLYLRTQGGYPGAITLAQLHHAYGKSGLELQWWDALTAAASNQLLTPAELALGAVRGTVNDQGLLVVSLDTSDSNVPRYTPAALNIIDEAAAAGVDTERLRALIGSIGLPMSAGQAASAFFRGILTQGGFNQAILEGDTRPEWAPFILDQAREILTAHTYVEGYLRGWVPDQQTLYDLTAQWGMSTADTDLLFETTGRPIAVHDVTRGQAYLDDQPGQSITVDGDYLRSLQQSNVRPPWYELALAAKQYTWPPYFVLKDIVPDPFSIDEAAAFLRYQGYRPDVAQAIANFLGGGSTKPKAETAADLSTQYEAGTLAPGDYTSALEALGYTSDAAAAKKAAVDARPLASARTAILTKLRNGVVGGSITPEQATEELGKTTVAPATIPLLVAAWQHENAIENLQPPASTPATA